MAVFCIKRKVNKISNFSPKPWINRFGKMLILWVFETDVFVVQKSLFPIQNVENHFFTIYFYDLWHGNTGGYKGLHGVTRLLFYLERQQTLFLDLFLINTKDEKTSTHGLSSLQKCQFCLLFKSMFILSRKACFLTRTSPNTFSGCILHKTKR